MPADVRIAPGLPGGQPYSRGPRVSLAALLASVEDVADELVGRVELSSIGEFDDPYGPTPLPTSWDFWMRWRWHVR